jgi:hypothetical protein
MLADKWLERLIRRLLTPFLRMCRRLEVLVR